MKDQNIWYEPHPVSAERKAYLRALGYRIIDAIYAPEGWQAPKHEVQANEEVIEAPEAPKRRGRPPKAAE